MAAVRVTAHHRAALAKADRSRRRLARASSGRWAWHRLTVPCPHRAGGCKGAVVYSPWPQWVTFAVPGTATWPRAVLPLPVVAGMWAWAFIVPAYRPPGTGTAGGALVSPPC